MITKNNYINQILEKFQRLTLVYTKSLGKIDFVNFFLNKIQVEDARSAGYIATGIAAETKAPVVLICKNDNESRSLMPSMTEAFYRSLPIIVILLSTQDNVSYNKNIKDVFSYTLNIQDFKSINEYNTCFDILLDIVFNKNMPVHIIIDCESTNSEINIDKGNDNYNLDKKNTDKLISIIKPNDYLFISKYITLKSIPNCKIYRPSNVNYKEGSVATVLGASLSNARDNYYALVTENELIHDINTLGNRYINDKIKIIVLCEKFNLAIADYAKSLDFSIQTSISNITNKQTIVFI